MSGGKSQALTNSKIRFFCAVAGVYTASKDIRRRDILLVIRLLVFVKNKRCPKINGDCGGSTSEDRFMANMSHWRERCEGPLRVDFRRLLSIVRARIGLCERTWTTKRRKNNGAGGPASQTMHRPAYRFLRNSQFRALRNE
ncbi:hypothetical protein, partial [Burkholderia cepacia]|uniref:hypothetical protein n=1 Tax=Burkholderia cepacia TaxID=292 RepID=UPI00196B56E0